MSIAVANIYTRNVRREFINAGCTDAEETGVAKRASMIVGAFAFIVLLPLPYAIQFQLLGGVWIIQTLAAVVFFLYTGFFNGGALLAGWAAGIAAATWMTAQLDFKAAIYQISFGGFVFFLLHSSAVLALNIAVAALLSLVSNAAMSNHGGADIPDA